MSNVSNQPAPAGVLVNGSARAAAVAEWQARQAEGHELTGAELAQRYGKSPSWGRAVAREARAAVTPSLQLETPDAALPMGNTTGRVTNWQRRTTGAAVLVVALVAAVISYSHMRQLALAAGEGAWQAAILPLSVDGMLMCASMTALVRKRSGQAVGVLPWLALMLGVGASVAANIASAEPTLTGRAIAAWPPVALLVSLEMLLRQTRETGR